MPIMAQTSNYGGLKTLSVWSPDALNTITGNKFLPHLIGASIAISDVSSLTVPRSQSVNGVFLVPTFMLIFLSLKSFTVTYA
jgi:hypothetical protein